MTEEREHDEQIQPDETPPPEAAEPAAEASPPEAVEPAAEASPPEAAELAGEAPPVAAVSTDEAPPREAQALLDEAPPAERPASNNLDVIMDLDLPLTVRFGQTQMTLGALVRIGAGSEISLERSPTDPVELMVNGKVIARGDVVAVEGNYAVRITDIVSPSERIANVGG